MLIALFFKMIFWWMKFLLFNLRQEVNGKSLFSHFYVKNESPKLVLTLKHITCLCPEGIC